ncbi:hypothetical protein NPIL_258551 [Nephila pilipes]|uniref:Uncharacterized protein n=1 Tax=Nephila pilipes TaxID=299642 RepID=A0A8X6UEY5_NEPPI|nr:hypothetical protein NPIL_258551 [Nephila pilipes]
MCFYYNKLCSKGKDLRQTRLLLHILFKKNHSDSRMAKYNPIMIVPKITQACSGIAAMFMFGYIWKADEKAGKALQERRQKQVKPVMS